MCVIIVIMALYASHVQQSCVWAMMPTCSSMGMHVAPMLSSCTASVPGIVPRRWLPLDAPRIPTFLKDHGIGLGLANSMLFTKALGGDL